MSGGDWSGRKLRQFGRRQVVRIGIIGIGFMGYTHFEGARDLQGAAVTAIATRDAKKLAGRLDFDSG